MVETYLLNHGWIAIVLFILLLCGDYYLTLVGARLALAVRKHIELEGSYETNPFYQEDIDKARKFSPRLLWNLILISFVLAYVDWVGNYFHSAYLYGIFVGMFVFVQAGIYKRHFVNIVTYTWHKRRENSLIGHVTAPRDYLVFLSRVDLFALAAFTFVAFLLTNSPILLGGALRFALLALQTNSWSQGNLESQPKEDV